jgi:hypothetical protein
MAEKAKWVPIVAVLGIIMGSFGIFGGIQYISMPQIMKFQKEMLPEMMKNIPAKMEKKQAEMKEKIRKAGVTGTAADNYNEKFADNYKKMMDKFMNFPEWYNTFCYIAGAIGILIGAFYLIASIMMMQWKMSGLKMFYAAVVISIVFLIARGVGIAMAMPNMFAISAVGSSLFSLIFNIVLLTVAANGSKEGLK